MKNINRYTTKGFASVVMLAAAIIILVVALALYGYFQSDGEDNYINNTIRNTINRETSEVDNDEEISTYDDVDTLEAELDSTQWGSVENDFTELERDLQGL